MHRFLIPVVPFNKLQIFILEHETYFERVSEVQRLVDQLPEPNKRMLEMLMSHLEKVQDDQIG